MGHTVMFWRTRKRYTNRLSMRYAGSKVMHYGSHDSRMSDSINKVLIKYLLILNECLRLITSKKRLQLQQDF